MIGCDDRYAPECALFRIPSFQFVMAPDQTVARPKPYVSIRELSALTPWTEQAIRTMMAKGILRERKHFFHVGRRPVFKWEAIVGFIEASTCSAQNQPEAVPHYRDRLTNGEA